MAIRKKFLPNVIKSSIEYLTENGYARKGEGDLSSLGNTLFQGGRRQKPDSIGVYSVPIKDLPELVKIRNAKLLKDLNPSDTVIVVQQTAVKSDQSNTDSQFTHVFVTSSQDAQRFIEEARKKPQVIDELVQNQFGGAVPQWDGKPLNVPARQVEFLKSNGANKAITTEATVDLPETYTFNKQETWDRLQNDEEEATLEEAAPSEEAEVLPQQEPPEADNSAVNGATVDTLRINELIEQKAQADRADAQREARLTKMREDHQKASEQAAKIRQAVQAATQRAQTPQQSQAAPPRQSPIAQQPILETVGQAATGEYISQQSSQRVATPAEQTARSFPNIPTDIPQPNFSPQQEFGESRSVINKTVDQLTNNIIDTLSPNQFNGNQLKNIRDSLTENYKQLLNESTAAYDLSTSAEDLHTALREKTTEIVKQNISAKLTEDQEKKFINKTNQAVSQTLYGTNQSEGLIDTLRNQRSTVFQNMKQQQSLGLWQDPRGQLSEHLRDRQVLQDRIDSLQSFQSAQTSTVRARDVEALKSEIDTLDSKFMNQNRTAVNSYVSTISAPIALSQQSSRFSEQSLNMSGFTNLMEQAKSGNAPLSESAVAQSLQKSSDQTIDRSVTGFTHQLTEEVQSGQTTPQEAAAKFSEYLKSQRDVFAAFQGQSQEVVTSSNNFYTRAENLERSITKGTDEVTSAFLSATQDKIGQFRYNKRGLTKKDEEQSLVEIIGWKKYEELTKSGEPLDIHHELIQLLGETSKPGVLAKLSFLGFESDASSINPTFFKELSAQIIRYGAENTDTQSGDVIKIYQDLYDKYVGDAPNAKIYQLTDDQISKISQKLLTSPKVQQALTAAKNASFVLPSLSELSDDDLKFALERTITGRSSRKYAESGLKTTYEQVFRDSIREDYIDSITTLLVAKGIDKTRAKGLAQDAVFATLGGTTQIDDGKGYVVENMGVLSNTQIQDFGTYHKIAIANMTQKQREKYLKQFPEYNSILQRNKTISQELLSSLKLNGAPLTQQELDKLVNETRREELHAEMASAEKKIPPLRIMIGHSEIDEVRGLFRTNILQSAIHGKFQDSVNYLMSFVPLKSVDKKALIMGQLLHLDKGSGDIEKEITSFLIRNSLVDANGNHQNYMSQIMAGKFPPELQGKLGTRQRNTLNTLTAKTSFMNKIAKIQAKHPRITALLSKYGKFLERNDVQLLRLLSSGNPIEKGFNAALNYLYNSYKLSTGKYKYYTETGRIENIARFERKLQRQKVREFKRRMRIFKVKQKIVNSRVFQWVAKSAVGKAFSKIRDSLIRFGAKFIPVIGQVVGVLDLLTFGLFSKLLLKLVKIIAELLIIWIVQALISLWVIPAAIYGAMQGFGAWVGKGMNTLQAGLKGFQFGGNMGMIGGNSVSLGIMNPVGLFQATVSWASNMGALLSSTGSALSGMLSWIPRLGAGAIPLAVVGVTSYYSFMNDNLETAAFMDGPEALSEISTSANFNQAKNPLKIVKSGPSQATVDGVILYKIQVESPACAKTITITDVIPTNAELDQTAPLELTPPEPQFPSSAIEKMTASYNPATRTITWIITVKDGQFQGPCTMTSGLGSADLRDSNAATVDEINAFLNGHNLQGMGETFIKYARETQVNPLLVTAILGYESQWGDTGIGRPPGPTGGCYNPGGVRNWPTGAGPVDGAPNCISDSYGRFFRFPSYDPGIKAAFYAVRNIIEDNNATTIEALSNRYIPVDEATANYVNCPRDGITSEPYPNREPNDQTSCIKGLNANWKWRVSCIMARKENCSFTLDEYRLYKANSGINSPGLTNKIIASLQFYAKPTANDVCISNTAKAQTGDSPNILQNSSQFSTAIGSAKCSFGLEIAQAASTTVGVDGEGPLIRCKDVINGQKNGGAPYTDVCYEGQIYYNHHLLFDGVPSTEQHLYQGPGAPGSEWFWCTWTPIKAYQAVGKTGLNGLLAAQGQKDYFATRSGYSVIRNAKGDAAQTLPINLRPGDVITYFTDLAPDIDHVGIVYSVNLDATGNGNIETRESNAEVKTRRINVQNNIPQGPSNGLQVAGFGNQDVVE